MAAADCAIASSSQQERPAFLKFLISRYQQNSLVHEQGKRVAVEIAFCGKRDALSNGDIGRRISLETVYAF